MIDYTNRVQPVGVCDVSFRRYILPRMTAPTLDVGCGQGTYLRHLPAGSVGQDLSAPNVEACRRQGLSCVQAKDPEALPFEAGAFGCLMFSHVLEHTPSPVRMLQEGYRVLAEGGLLVLGLPLEGTLALPRKAYFDDHPGHLYAFSEVNADRLVRACGFIPDGLFYFVRGTNRFRLGFLLPVLHALPRCLLRQVSVGYWLLARKTTAAVKLAGSNARSASA